jgi:hypothetical protein
MVEYKQDAGGRLDRNQDRYHSKCWPLPCRISPQNPQRQVIRIPDRPAQQLEHVSSLERGAQSGGLDSPIEAVPLRNDVN